MRKLTAIMAIATLLITIIAASLLLLPSKSGITGMQAAELPDEAAFEYKILFCSETDCLDELASMINSSSRVDCALYNFNDRLTDAAMGREARVVTSSSYKGEQQFIRKSNGSGLMHNKFCIFNGSTVLTGSFNPSSSGKDRNNIIVIRSKHLAANYEGEFNELWNCVYGKGEKTESKKFKLNSTLIESYFCPEDGCADKVQAEIESAGSSVYFMAYSFTHRGIANSLILRSISDSSDKSGVDVRGVIDSSSDKEVYELLKAQGLNIKIDDKKGVMHHKVFIIDGKTVITGSFNPTYSADEKNDENLLVIHSEEVAARYLEEFGRVAG
ncbi:hypothetical protein HYV82_06600 [Candidatus Woesearchaeota archaeon]|nr:hypothetical protein [Candidatus Woesearchaeota archaeon]